MAENRIKQWLQRETGQLKLSASGHCQEISMKFMQKTAARMHALPRAIMDGH